MDGLGIVPEGFLGEALGVAAGLGPFCPRVPIRVKSHTGDPKGSATLLELGGPVATAHGAQVWEERSGHRQSSQDFDHGVPQVNLRCGSRLSTQVADDRLIPIDVFRTQLGDVGLRTAEVPAQFVEGAALRVAFPGDDPGVFVGGDGPLLTEPDGGPLRLRDERPGQPGHRETEVVELPEVNVGGHRAPAEGVEKVFCAGLNDDLRKQRQQRLVLRSHCPSPLGGSALGGHIITVINESSSSGLFLRFCCFSRRLIANGRPNALRYL